MKVSAFPKTQSNPCSSGFLENSSEKYQLGFYTTIALRINRSIKRIDLLIQLLTDLADKRGESTEEVNETILNIAAYLDLTLQI